MKNYIGRYLLSFRRLLIRFLAGRIPIVHNVTILKNRGPCVGLSPSDDGVPKAVFTENASCREYDESGNQSAVWKFE